MGALHIQTTTLCNKSLQIWQPETIHTSGRMVSMSEESSLPQLGPVLEYFSQDSVKGQARSKVHLKNQKSKLSSISFFQGC